MSWISTIGTVIQSVETIRNDCAGIISTLITPESQTTLTQPSPDLSDHLDELQHIGHSGEPILFFINSNSGGKAGEILIQKLHRYYNPMYVIDLLKEKGPQSAIERFLGLLMAHNARVVVAGGDGTARWVMECLSNFGIVTIPVGIIPLGTGNDLSRSLGWGGGVTKDDIQNDAFVLKSVLEYHKASAEPFDLWDAVFTDLSKPTEVPPTKQFMINYFSFGIDAHIALQFHNARNANPNQFTSALTNKAMYALYGLDAVTYKGLNGSVVVWIDDRMVPISSDVYSGYIVTNVSAYHGGVDFWGNQSKKTTDDDDDGFGASRFNDGVLEVMAVADTTHIGLVHVGA
eukprot:PhF_6_TR8460/c0_g1_i1/m.13211/K00901/dgkA, DGK; diacylglycerol kinase (ATP)